MIKLSNITKFYGEKGEGKHALKNISFDLYSHEIHGLIGKNGAGKSTCMKILAGLLPFDEGEISLQQYENENENENKNQSLVEKITSESYQGLNEKSWQRNPFLIGVLSEVPQVYWKIEARDFLLFFKNLFEIKEVDFNYWKDFFEIEHYWKKSFYQMSKGQVQRINLVRVMMTRPSVLILDEPNSGLDPVGIYELRNMLMKLRDERQASILYSSHQISELEGIVDRVTLLKAGEVTFSGEKKLFLNDSGMPSDVHITVDEKKFKYDDFLQQARKENIEIVRSSYAQNEFIIKGSANHEKKELMSFVLAQKNILGDCLLGLSTDVDFYKKVLERI